MNREELKPILIKTLQSLNGSANILSICKHIWKNYLSKTLTPKDKSFYTWQYDVRWAASMLRKEGIIEDHKKSPRGVWQLTK